MSDGLLTTCCIYDPGTSARGLVTRVVVRSPTPAVFVGVTVPPPDARGEQDGEEDDAE